MNKLTKHEPPTLQSLLPKAEIDIRTLARKNIVVPTVNILAKAFMRLPWTERIKENEFLVMVEEQSEVTSELKLEYKDPFVQRFTRKESGFIRFTKCNDNGNIIWIYTGPVKV